MTVFCRACACAPSAPQRPSGPQEGRQTHGGALLELDEQACNSFVAVRIVSSSGKSIGKTASDLPPEPALTHRVLRGPCVVLPDATGAGTGARPGRRPRRPIASSTIGAAVAQLRSSFGRFGRRSGSLGCHCAVVARYYDRHLAVAGVADNSREIVDAARPEAASDSCWNRWHAKEETPPVRKREVPRRPPLPRVHHSGCMPPASGPILFDRLRHAGLDRSHPRSPCPRDRRTEPSSLIAPRQPDGAKVSGRRQWSPSRTGPNAAFACSSTTPSQGVATTT